MKKNQTLIFCVFSIILIWGCKTLSPTPTGLVTKKAMVVSARAEASEIGTQILKAGGNAFDAMVATELALVVAYPFAGNIGGGGFMVYRKANGSTGAIDYREKAPLSASKDMYLDASGEVIPNMSTLGATAVGVPGTVAGIIAVHKKFGKLPLEELVKPVIALALNGVVVTKKQAKHFSEYKDLILEANGGSTSFPIYAKQGDTLRFPALAKTLQRVAKYGSDGFYSGETAKILASFIEENGGFVTTEDLEKYKAKWRTPISFEYKDLKIISMSPPSSGGITLQQILTMMAPYKLNVFGHNSVKEIQLFTEAARRAYADRNYYLGDPDFVSIPTAYLTSDAYLKNRMQNFSFDRATPSKNVQRGEVQTAESMETTHYSIVDAEGNAVSVTTTLNGAYGSKLYCDKLGFFLNNEMDDFSAKAGVPNMFGLIGAEANSIAPEKRMLSSMTPTIVEKDKDLYMVVGTPGGSTIITAVAQTILNTYEFNMSMQQAVDAPRFHHQWLPDVIMFEPTGFSIELKNQLKGKGYQIYENQSPIIGKVNAIRKLPSGNLEGGADHRGDDTAIGY